MVDFHWFSLLFFHAPSTTKVCMVFDDFFPVVHSSRCLLLPPVLLLLALLCSFPILMILSILLLESMIIYNIFVGFGLAPLKTISFRCNHIPQRVEMNSDSIFLSSFSFFFLNRLRKFLIQSCIERCDPYSATIPREALHTLCEI